MPRRLDSQNECCTVTGPGHVRITSGLYRHWYAQRLVMKDMCQEFCYWTRDEKTGIPKGFHVHHVDDDKQHNCRQNLQLLQMVIHNWITLDQKRFRDRHHDQWVLICLARATGNTSEIDTVVPAEQAA